MGPAQRHDVCAGGQATVDLAKAPAEESGIAQRHFEKLHSGPGAGLHLGLEEYEGQVEQQDRPGHPERVGHRIANGRVVVADRRDRGL